MQRARLLATLSSELAFDRDPRNAEVPSDEALAIARASGDPGLLVTVLGLRLIGLWRPDRVSVRLDHAAELEAICRMAGDARRGKFLSAMTMCCQAVMEAGDLVSADRLLAWIEETAGTLKQPTSLGYAKLRLASRACIAGRFEEAEQLADEAYFYCAKSGQPDAAAFHTGQIFTIRLHQGRTDEVIDRMALAFRDHPGIETFAAGEAFCAADLGDAARCRRALVPVLAALGDLRFDLNWLATLGLASRAVHFLGDRDAAARIKRMIEPYRNLYIDNASAFFGSALHSFAVLSSMEVSDSDDIVRSFDRARAAHDSLKSPPWQARTLVEYARYMRTSGHPDRARDLAESALDLGRDYALAWVAAEAASLLAALADTSTR